MTSKNKQETEHAIKNQHPPSEPFHCTTMIADCLAAFRGGALWMEVPALKDKYRDENNNTSRTV